MAAIKKIILGYPLDLLLNRACIFTDYEKYIPENSIKVFKKEQKKLMGGIELPSEKAFGTGNIVIRGKPGTAKSTLALQIAVSAAQKGNDVSSFYITLEESPESIKNKCDVFGWGDTCHILEQLTIDDDLKGEDVVLNKLLKTPCVLISTLTPRSIHQNNESKNNLFNDRYQQLEAILIAAKSYNDQKARGKMGFVIIDSINVFGEGLLLRSQLFRLFDLFKRYKIIGVFIVEEDEKSIYRTDDKLQGETLEYIADLVISLTVGEDEGYSLRYFEIIKSRYQHQVYGKHPFKIFEKRKDDSGTSFPLLAVRIFPSLHYLVYATDISKNKHQEPENKTDYFCDQDINYYLSKEPPHGNSVLIEGTRDTFKTSLAHDFLMNGVLCDYDSHVLFIRFQDYSSLKDKLESFTITESCRNEIYDSGKKPKNYRSFIENNGKPKPFWGETPTKAWEGFNLDNCTERETQKRFLSSYISTFQDRSHRFTELVYQTGYILPEEFVHILLETILNKPKWEKPSRIAIEEIGRIGSSYPLLLKSKTAGGLFLSAVFHIIRNYGIKLVITGTTNDYPKSDEVINKVKTLVDDILTTKKINVFGDNFITIQGGRLSSAENPSRGDYPDENVPGVIIPTEDQLIKIDKEMLNGLVGFDTANIYRPGIDLYLFNENKVQIEYNNEVQRLLNYAFNTWGEKTLSGEMIIENKIENKGFNDMSSPTFHDSLGLLQGKPIKKTVVCMIDEFFVKNNKRINALVPINKKIVDEIFKDAEIFNPDKNEVYSLPYYDNVLVLVYNTDYYAKQPGVVFGDHKSWSLVDWIELEKIINAKKVSNPKKPVLDMIFETDETLCCLLLDALFSGLDNDTKKKLDSDQFDLNELLDPILKNLGSKSAKYLVRNLIALKRIIKLCKRSNNWAVNNTVKTDRIGAKTETDIGLIGNSIFYICWYSQLRDLLGCNPELSSKLEVFALPGGGFTGDWEVALLKGSVSANLGIEVLKFLCSKEEDYKRFVKGVGLPSKGRFYSGPKKLENIEACFQGWPNSKIEISNELNGEILEDLKVQKSVTGQVTLPQIFKLYYIHSHAHKRSGIKNYSMLRNSLLILFKQLIMTEENSIKDAVLRRMPGLIKRFSE